MYPRTKQTNMCTNPLVSYLRFDPETFHIQSPSANHFQCNAQGYGVIKQHRHQ